MVVVVDIQAEEDIREALLEVVDIQAEEEHRVVGKLNYKGI